MKLRSIRKVSFLEEYGGYKSIRVSRKGQELNNKMLTLKRGRDISVFTSHIFYP